ncbi:MAG: FliM/FliN family flagellar motor switch protein [Candidatus Sulfotelmatobacter sp.]
MANAGGAGVALAVEQTSAAGSEAEAEGLWKPVLDLGCELTVDLPIPNFKISDLLKLHKGSIVNAQWRLGRDVPLCLNATRIGWIEFEVMGGNLAVRLTELA